MKIWGKYKKYDVNCQLGQVFSSFLKLSVISLNFANDYSIKIPRYPDINYSDVRDIRGEEGQPQHFRMRAKFSLLFWFTKIQYFIYVLTREMLKICLSSKKKKMERMRILKWLGGENEVNVAWTRHCCGLPSSPRYLKIQKSN